MSNKNIISYYTEVEKFYFSPIVTLGYGVHNGDYLNLYVFLGKNTTFGEGIFPPEVILTPSENKRILKNMIVMKKANLNEISPVVERVDWKANTFYYAYSQDLNLGQKDAARKLTKQFYVRNRYDQVFKCLWNNITSANSYAVNSVANNLTHYTISHEGGTFDVGGLITIDNASPTEYNGTYRVVGSSVGRANIICAFAESFSLSANNIYSSGGKIKPAPLTTEEPVLGTGTFDDDIIIKTSDGYKWKYIYTVDKGSKLKFLDNDWMPVPIKDITKYPYSANVGWGSIDTIDIVAGGESYTNGTNTVTILITGDGAGASGEAFVANNEIQNITILSKGYDYTYANVSAIPSTGYGGSGAEFKFSISPIGGHRYDLLQEFYCSDIIVSVPFDKTEEGRLPTNFTFNQVGLIYNPYLKSDIVNHSNSSFISCTTDLLMSSLGVSYISGETVFQGSSPDNSTFRATVLAFDTSNNFLSLINTTGTPQESYELLGQTSGSVRVVQQINYSSFVPNSGSIFYLENRLDVHRDALGTEQIRVLINYS